MIPTSLNQLLGHQRTLLLQGPMGAFFSTLAASLRAQGQSVWKVNFNGGDDHYFADDSVLRFTGDVQAWPDFLNQALDSLQIDAVVLFGQTRVLHEQAVAVAEARGLAVYVFEEGYLRPDYVTLERGGVNAESSIPRSAEFYRDLDIELQPTPRPTRQEFGEVANIAMTYAVALWRRRRLYPHYEHHRCLHPVREGLRWVRGGWRKWKNRWLESHMLDLLSAPEQHKRYFLVPLQVHNDSQIVHHSSFGSVANFIEQVLQSFAEHAGRDQWLVFKHHPLDRPYQDYRELIAGLARGLGLGDRVHYIHDQHLPTLLQHAKGVVTVNSTTGLQSMYHGTPVITLGECFYAVPGMVHAGPLAHFWRDPGEVDKVLFQTFRHYLVRETQLNASFYGEAPGLPSSKVDSRRMALALSSDSAEAQAESWSSPTVPTLK
jgi:capsular polysaccharide export protein